MYGKKYAHGNYPGKVTGKYDAMNAQGYIGTIVNGLDGDIKTLAHRTWSKPDFMKKINL